MSTLHCRKKCQLFSDISRCLEAGDCMIIIRRIGIEDGCTAIAKTFDLCLCFRNPARTVLASNMNHHVVLHSARMVAARARPLDPLFLSMHLHHMLLQATLLNECLVATSLLARIVIVSRVFLHVVKHRVLTFLCFSAIRTNKETCIVFDILGHRTLRYYLVGPHQVFSKSATNRVAGFAPMRSIRYCRGTLSPASAISSAI
jgi:hypothetical protein